MTATATRTVCELLGPGFERCESPSLRLEKFVHVGGNGKAGEIAAVVKCHRQSRTRHDAAALLPLPRLPAGAVRFSARLGGRLIVNQAGGILENAGLCLHPHFGCPLLPGSAVKGVAAHAAWCAWRDEADAAGRRRLALCIAAVFGFPTSDDLLDRALTAEAPSLFEAQAGELRMLAGSVSFLPALPADPGKVELVVDIVNCHHPKYYQGKQAHATDNEEPVPNVFPAVKDGAEFVFTLVPLDRPLPAGLCAVLPAGFSPVDLAKAWLVQGITIHGAGAKTAAGYGWFEYDAEAERRRAAQRLEAERLQREAEARQAEEERRRRANEEQRIKVATLSPDEIADDTVSAWDERQFESRLRNFWKAKGGPSEAEKNAMVRALRSTRLSLWTELKQRGTKGEWARVVDSIRQQAKRLGPEKMP